MYYKKKYLKYKTKYLQLKEQLGGDDPQCNKIGRSRVGSGGVIDYSGIRCELTRENLGFGVCSKGDYGTCTFHKQCSSSNNSKKCNENLKGCFWTGNSCKQTKKVNCGDTNTEILCNNNPKGCFWSGTKCIQQK